MTGALDPDEIVVDSFAGGGGAGKRGCGVSGEGEAREIWREGDTTLYEIVGGPSDGQRFISTWVHKPTWLKEDIARRKAQAAGEAGTGFPPFPRAEEP